eukprot:s259_g16.t1
MSDQGLRSPTAPRRSAGLVLLAVLGLLQPVGKTWTGSPSKVLPRRALLSASVLGAAGPLWTQRAAAQEGPEQREALYRGKVVGLRESAEWYRFFVGDIVRRGGGENAPDGLKITDDECGGGLCSAGKALTELEGLVSAGGPRQGGLSQVERALTTPMFLIVGAEVWDPDSNYIEDARKVAGSFQQTMQELGTSLKAKKDAVAADKLYRRSLSELNQFFQICNEAGGAKQTDVEFLPPLPLKDDELESSEYWIAERKAFDELNDPVRIFSERNAFGSRELRYNLKRFPGATLLLR